MIFQDKIAEKRRLLDEILNRLAYTDKVLVPLEEGARKDDPILMVHPNYVEDTAKESSMGQSTDRAKPSGAFETLDESNNRDKNNKNLNTIYGYFVEICVIVTQICVADPLCCTWTTSSSWRG